MTGRFVTRAAKLRQFARMMTVMVVNALGWSLTIGVTLAMCVG